MGRSEVRCFDKLSMNGIRVCVAALVVISTPALADDVTASPPIDVSVTVYRAPSRNGGNLNLRQLGGFAVVTETRRVVLPAGESRLRFEGVVDGIIPESAIVAGLPGGVVEKNRDAALLSPSALLRAAVGSTLQLKRTDPVTGKVRAIPAQIESASDAGVMFRTAEGIEALRCSGLPETFRFERAANGLSATPTLSTVTRARRATAATVTLTYIAEAFDWAANYTATINPDGKTLHLGGWITLANGNSVSLNNASTQIVAGGLNREYFERFVNNQPHVVAKCFPMQRTSDIPRKPERPYTLASPYLPGPPAGYEKYGDEIMVTAQRREAMLMDVPVAVSVMSAASPPPPPPPEQLGDLKLYRVPQRTTIAANQMKQTRLIEQADVPFERLYAVSLDAQSWSSAPRVHQATILLRTHNDKAHQLGLPLPAGAIIVEQDQLGRTMMVGQPTLNDTAEGEKVELLLGSAPDVTVTRTVLQTAAGIQVQRVELANATDQPADFELTLRTWNTQKVTNADLPMTMRDGDPLFRLTLPANDTLTLNYTVSN